jgi:hypothetical protein
VYEGGYSGEIRSVRELGGEGGIICTIKDRSADPQHFTAHLSVLLLYSVQPTNLKQVMFLDTVPDYLSWKVC